MYRCRRSPRLVVLGVLVAMFLCCLGCDDDPQHGNTEDQNDLTKDNDSDLGDLVVDSPDDSPSDSPADSPLETADLNEDGQDALAPPAEWTALDGPASAPFVGVEAGLLWAAGDTLQLFSESWSVQSLGADTGRAVSMALDRDAP